MAILGCIRSHVGASLVPMTEVVASFAHKGKRSGKQEEELLHGVVA